MDTRFRRWRMPALIAVVALVRGPEVFAETAPVGDGAYPPFGSCTSSTPPDLPDAWQATTLLTAFGSEELEVAAVSADAALNAMRVTTVGLQNGSEQDWLIVGSQVYSITSDQGGNLSCSKSTQNPTHWDVPVANWLAAKNCQCMGSNSVAGKEAEAWRCPNGLQEDNNGMQDEYDWFWFAKNENRFPQRFLFSRTNNAQHLPVLGDKSMVHLPEFVASGSPDLKAVVELCVQGKPTSQKTPTPSIAGVSAGGCDSVSLPEWPNTAFANGALFAVDGSYTSMAIYYDWGTMQEVSKIKSQTGLVTDERLTRAATYSITHYPDGSYQCTPAGVLENVGIWHPNWPDLDGCKCKATIAPGSVLNPSEATIQAMSCHFGGPSYIQAWYSTQGKPVMFYETNARDLDLIDYYTWLPDATMPQGIFDEPKECMKMTGAPITGCNKCHDKDQ